MKANHTYETVIKSKLDQLTGPDAGIMWNDMEGILDVHMPQKKKRRIIGWWFFDGGMGMNLGIAFLIIVGSITGYRILNNKENITATTINTQSQESTTDSKNITSSGKNTTTGTAGSGNNTATSSTSIDLNDDNRKLSNASTNTDISSSQTDGMTGKFNNNNNKIRYNTAPDYTKNRMNGFNISRNQSATGTPGSRNKESVVSVYNNSKDFNSLLQVQPQTQNYSIHQTGIKAPGTDVIAELNNKPGRKGWVVGGSFNYHMPVSNQVMSTVNSNGTKGNLVDYLPSIYVQYHLNEKWYLQTEIQYSSPQYTPNHILFDQWSNMNTHQKEENVVYLDKLYYLSVPVTIHYSPFKNIQVGTGLQFSHLVKSILPDEHSVWQNGMEGWQKTIVNNKIYSTSPNGRSKKATTPARIDTVSQNFRSTDLRMVLDANYNLGKVNVGFTFNVGLSNYMNIKSGTNSILIKDRNEDLKIYLKYKLWDQRRKKVKP